MRILAFSDLHCDLDGAASLVEQSEAADVVIGAGDFASVHDRLEETISALAAITTPTLLVPGNNETEDALRAASAGWESATVLHGETAEVGGRSFYGLGAGIPTTPWDWSFDLAEEAAEEKLAGAGAASVWILHSPPKGHVDKGFGSTAILAAIENAGPELAVCGHIHECWGQESLVGDTRVMNLGPAGTVIELDSRS